MDAIVQLVFYQTLPILNKHRPDYRLTSDKGLIFPSFSVNPFWELQVEPLVQVKLNGRKGVFWAFRVLLSLTETLGLCHPESERALGVRRDGSHVDCSLGARNKLLKVTLKYESFPRLSISGFFFFLSGKVKIDAKWTGCFVTCCLFLKNQYLWIKVL